MGIPVMFIRYNPDPFKVDGKSRAVSFTKRMERLRIWIEHVKVYENFGGEWCSFI